MATGTVLQTVLACVFAALGILGFLVSIHPPRTRRGRWTYLGAFIVLTILGVVIVFWQGRLAERSQVAADKAIDELRRKVAVLYRLQTSTSRRPTEDEIESLADRAYGLRREASSRVSPDLALTARVLAAEVRLFAAERAKSAPRVETMESSAGVSRLVDDMKLPPPPEPQSVEEMLDQADRRFQTTYIDPAGRVGLTEDEKRWRIRNKHAIDHYFETRQLFEARFQKRLDAVAASLYKAHVVKEHWVLLARFQYSSNEKAMNELAFLLDEAADRLPKGEPLPPGY
jgi:hypothetical protein